MAGGQTRAGAGVANAARVESNLTLATNIPPPAPCTAPCAVLGPGRYLHRLISNCGGGCYVRCHTLYTQHTDCNTLQHTLLSQHIPWCLNLPPHNTRKYACIEPTSTLQSLELNYFKILNATHHIVGYNQPGYLRFQNNRKIKYSDM